jgi:hypothetical protein
VPEGYHYRWGEGRLQTPLLSQAGLLSSGIARTQGVTTAIDAGRAPPEPAAAFTRVVARQAGASVGFPLVGLHLRHTRRWAGAATSEYAGNDKTHDDALHQHCSLRWGARCARLKTYTRCKCLSISCTLVLLRPP